VTNTRRLSKRERQQLRAIIRTESAAQVVRRAQALLWLANGESVPAVAERLGVVRQTIYNWQQVFIRRSTEPLPQRLRDEPRSGRPARKMAMALCWLPRLLRCSPRAFGYRARSWTSGRLCKQIERHSHIAIGLNTVRRALHQIRYRFKRPRYVLARRSAYWRQAKGG
jgi:transposase